VFDFLNGGFLGCSSPFGRLGRATGQGGVSEPLSVVSLAWRGGEESFSIGGAVFRDGGGLAGALLAGTLGD
jgi:hypothetical protein